MKTAGHQCTHRIMNRTLGSACTYQHHTALSAIFIVQRQLFNDDGSCRRDEEREAESSVLCTGSVNTTRHQCMNRIMNRIISHQSTVSIILR